MTKINYKSKSFTLIELLVVIFIIALLASIVAVQVNKARWKSQTIKAVADLKSIQTALAMYSDEFGLYPSPVDYDEAVTGCKWDFEGDDLDSNGISWLDPLVENGYLGSAPTPPGNISYRYKDSASCTCAGSAGTAAYIVVASGLPVAISGVTDNDFSDNSASWDLVNCQSEVSDLVYSVGSLE
ncbi:MAG: hypothetical protein COU81_02880 [Candidatus Portnoybacteria bacterium CG10_big_fil_rev_8_21_14_0_10_36_7]|uniref:Type II secretion system protein GspG C-terminal domain-containing protein n=1 Tax=Candidatus Portnoybacteria bacterium CG10_big_fil_rev_8_21_14_0_10_36_7 TaxID=1974812 RepID=A0A2M8KDP8_9BACT|nr:MAG: hypothetical protein COU81_02880 [Candidatus Portnoybacteria bacterium CG10_big_fil_rev_8_21_14_0_10_36_7]